MKNQFYLFLFSRMSTFIANSLFFITFIWFLQKSTDTSTTAFTYSFLGLSIVFILPLGVYIDRLKPGILNTSSIIIQVFCVLLFILLFDNFIDGKYIYLIVFVLFISAVFMDVYTPSSNTLLTQILDSSAYKKANSIVQTSDQILNLIGYVLIGFLITTIGPKTTLMISLSLFVIAIVLNFTLIKYLDLKVEPPKVKRKFSKSIQEGLSIILKTDLLRFTIPISIFSNVIVAIIIAILPGISENKGIHFFTAIYICFFIGFVIGALLSNKIPETLNNIYTIGVLNGFILLSFGYLMNSYWSLVVIVLFGIGSGIINIFDETIYQMNTPKEEMGNVLTLKRFILSFAYPIGGFIAGYLALHLEIRNVIYFSAFIKIFLDIVLIISIKRYRKGFS